MLEKREKINWEEKENQWANSPLYINLYIENMINIRRLFHDPMPNVTFSGSTLFSCLCTLTLITKPDIFLCNNPAPIDRNMTNKTEKYSSPNSIWFIFSRISPALVIVCVWNDFYVYKQGSWAMAPAPNDGRWVNNCCTAYCVCMEHTHTRTNSLGSYLSLLSELITDNFCHSPLVAFMQLSLTTTIIIPPFLSSFTFSPPSLHLKHRIGQLVFVKLSLFWLINWQKGFAISGATTYQLFEHFTEPAPCLR